MPRFSVIVPVYNRAATVLPTLESARDQTFADFECIVVDDGSTDGEQLREVVESLGDPRFRYVRRENGGGSAARNTGIDEAKGVFVAFLDSDDLWLARKLEVQSEQLARSPDRVVYCASIVDRGVRKHWVRPSRGIRATEDMGEYLFANNQFIQTSAIALGKELAKATRWDSTIAKVDDVDFVLRLAAKGHRFEFRPEPLVIWRDVTEEGRYSRIPGIGPAEALLAKHGRELSARARNGLLVTYLAYDLAKEKPMKALPYFVRGVFGAVPLKVIARQLLRAYLPRRAYRLLVNSFVAVAGRSGEHARI